MTDWDYNSVQDFVAFRTQYCVPATITNVREGNYFSSSYIWEKDYIVKGKPAPDSFFGKWDFFPFFLCTQDGLKSAKNIKYYKGLNMHFLSVPERLSIIKDSKIISKSRADLAVRNYRYDNTRRLWFVPFEVATQMALFYSDTYFLSSYGKVTGVPKAITKRFVSHYYNETEDELYPKPPYA